MKEKKKVRLMDHRRLRLVVVVRVCFCYFCSVTVIYSCCFTSLSLCATLFFRDILYLTTPCTDIDIDIYKYIYKSNKPTVKAVDESLVWTL